MKISIRALAFGLALMSGTASADSVRTIEYKGRYIQIAADGSGDECLALLRRAIDMTAELKPKQRALTTEIKDLRCAPVPSEKRNNSVAHNTVGVYTMETPDSPSGFIRFPLKAKDTSAAEMVLSLMGNGIYARWHKTYLAAKARGNSDPVARKYHILLTKADTKAVLMAECEHLENEHAAILSLGLGQRRAAYTGKRMDMRGCPT